MADKSFEYLGGNLYRFTLKTEEHTQMIDITSRIEEIIKFSGVSAGLCVVDVPHTTAGVTVNENADPDVQKDMMKELDQIVPWENGYAHDEGNSAAHGKASLMGMSQTLLIRNQSLLLGTWQAVYFMEFDGSRERTVYVKLV